MNPIADIDENGRVYLARDVKKGTTVKVIVRSNTRIIVHKIRYSNTTDYMT